MAVFKDATGKSTQHVYGVVLPDGQTISGSGCQVRRIWSGTYLVEYEHPFSNAPAPICTINGNEWQTFDKSVAIVETTPFYFVYVTSSPDRPEDCAVSFIAFGDL